MMAWAEHMLVGAGQLIAPISPNVSRRDNCQIWPGRAAGGWQRGDNQDQMTIGRDRGGGLVRESEVQGSKMILMNCSGLKYYFTPSLSGRIFFPIKFFTFKNVSAGEKE